ncbi:sugar kinase [Paenibacillus sacheonensis]|uniref:Sugar kinase n=1 Tax=Paenibacillus sacheonensis TaxID=742054 RepID=A0A7X5BXR8_9BACL|nr:sugar kinase [Paenibacillus sacheonensis]MBM7565985.1 2-dehydro-3-deoxygluconokinase [Paenibacillus sacheonensis]NBC68701.1 sugar kinase [Paenibacillus sacheonensis]
MSRIAAFGEVMMRLETPGYSTLSQSGSLAYSFSGSGVNVVSALSRFGHETYLASTLPDNSLGDAALSYLRKLGVQTTFVNRGGRYVGMYFLERGFGIRPGKVTYTDRLGSSFNTVPHDPADWERIADAVDAVHFCGITLAMNELARTQIKRLASVVKSRGGKVIFDCNYRPSLWGEDGHARAKPHYREMLELADIVFMNEKDALLTLGMTSSSGAEDPLSQLLELIPQVAKQYGIGTIAGTHRRVNADNTHTLTGYLHADGAFWFAQPSTFAVYDRVGAGDAYASGIMHACLRGDDPQYAVDYATAAAVLAHTVHGDTPLASEADVVKAMSRKAGDIER